MQKCCQLINVDVDVQGEKFKFDFLELFSFVARKIHWQVYFACSGIKLNGSTCFFAEQVNRHNYFFRWERICCRV